MIFKRDCMFYSKHVSQCMFLVQRSTSRKMTSFFTRKRYKIANKLHLPAFFQTICIYQILQARCNTLYRYKNVTKFSLN